MAKQVLICAGLGAAVLAVAFAILEGAIYDPAVYRFGPRDLSYNGSGHWPLSALAAAIYGLFDGAVLGAVVGGVIGAVVRAARRT